MSKSVIIIGVSGHCNKKRKHNCWILDNNLNLTNEFAGFSVLGNAESYLNCSDGVFLLLQKKMLKLGEKL